MKLTTFTYIKYSIITVFLVGFFLSASIFPLPICAAGEIVGWSLQKTPNEPLTNLTKVAAGVRHSLALKSKKSDGRASRHMVSFAAVAADFNGVQNQTEPSQIYCFNTLMTYEEVDYA